MRPYGVAEGLCVIVGPCGSLWGLSGSLWGRRGSLWVIVGLCGVAVGHCGVSAALRPPQPPLRLHVHRDRVLVWAAEAVRTLRERYRMWGALVGAPSRRGGGRRLPLQLLPEEGRLLAELGAARLEPEPETGRPEAGAKRPRSRGPEVGEEGQDRDGPEVGAEGADVESKRPRLCGTTAGAEGVETEGPEVDNEGQEADTEEPEVKPEGLEAERPEVEGKGPETERPEVGTEGPEVRADRPEVEAEGPEAEAHRERRFRVYRDLWGRGLHLTAGGKFGGDFLVYPGPPPLFHAAAVALCPRSSTPLPLGALLSAARLGTAARKSLLLCAAPPGGAPEYSALRWRRDLG